MVETPVLFITFVRPDYARQTWEGIKAAQPKTLYFYSNKGRAEKDGEIERNNEIRSYVKEVDWDCDVHTWFRDECVNVYDSLRGAIDWLFDNEERGIILEEDCVPTKAFFSFVDQMIVKFKDEPKVWCISGDNYSDENIPTDYYFSQYHWMYGWASWANRWHSIDLSLLLDSSEIKPSLFKGIYKTRGQINQRVKELRRNVDFVNKTKCWDYYWGYLMDGNKAVTVHPSRHLITNVGLSGTHHSTEILSPINKKASPLSDSYLIKKEPTCVKADLNIDYNIYMILRYVSFWGKVKSSLRYRIPLYFNEFIRRHK